jgi:hypothetical protein
MIRDIPPLAVEGVDPWEKVQIDPATRRLAEHAAASAGLGVEEWLERAIRRACPSAFRSASVTIPSTPVVAPTFAAPPAPPRPIAPPPAAVTPPAQPPEIEASLAALLAMAQRQQAQTVQSQPQPAQPLVEARYAAPVDLPPPLPPLPPIAPIVRQAAPPQPAPLPPPAPVAEPPAALRRAPTIAERLARQRFDEEEEQAAETVAEPSDERDWQEADAAPDMFAGDDDEEEPRRRAEPKQRFKLWATRDADEGDREPRCADAALAQDAAASRDHRRRHRARRHRGRRYRAISHSRTLAFRRAVEQRKHGADLLADHEHAARAELQQRQRLQLVVARHSELAALAAERFIDDHRPARREQSKHGAGAEFAAAGPWPAKPAPEQRQQ